MWVLLDLSAAFDTVYQEVLFRRKESSFGASGTSLQWFGSYIGGRSQRIFINGGYPDTFDLRFGVPQVSCLGPLLFTIYASKLFEVKKETIFRKYMLM